MKLITDRTALGRARTRCIERHDKISFAVAWATSGTKVYELLKMRRSAIRAGVIETHFYQTSPDVLEDFVDDGAVRFVLQPSGVFHPRTFLFQSAKRWDAFVGSANLTRGALTRNSETMLHVSDADVDATAVRDDLKEAIRGYRAIGSKATSDQVESYRTAYERMKAGRERLSGDYGSDGAVRPNAPRFSCLVSATISNGRLPESRPVDRLSFSANAMAYTALTTRTNQILVSLTVPRGAICIRCAAVLSSAIASLPQSDLSSTKRKIFMRLTFAYRSSL